MENQITCPHCKKTIANDPLIESAAKGEDLGSSFITCECGEKITFWAITAQLRDQRKPVARIQHWIHSFSKG
jgi:hypothetical protein